MARLVLNSPQAAVGKVKKTATYTFGRISVPQSSSVTLVSVAFAKAEATTRILVNCWWQAHTAISYAVGLRVWFDGQASELYTGSQYFWMHSGGSDGGQALHLITAQKIITPQDYNGTSSWAPGNYTLQLGYNSATGSANQLGAVWNPDRSDDSRGNGPVRGQILVMELS